MSYTSQPNIPTLTPVEVYRDDQQPLKDQIKKIYTDTANVVNDKARSNIFSQYVNNEDITNDTWVDQKAIFRKVLTTGALNAGANNIPHGIIDSGGANALDVLTDIRVVVANGASKRVIPYSSPTAANCASVEVNGLNIVITLGAGFGAGYTGYILFWYTKV